MKSTTNAVIPAGFGGLVGRLAAQRAAQMPHPKTARRVRLLDAARAAVAAGKLPGMLEFASEANYSYNRHAAELHRLAKAGFLDEVMGYPITGTNTYAKALVGYRSLLVEAMQRAEAAAAPASASKPKAKAKKPAAKASKAAPKPSAKKPAKKPAKKGAK